MLAAPLEFHVSKRSRPARPRPPAARRYGAAARGAAPSEVPSPVSAAPAPRAAPAAQTVEPSPSTRITTTDYGYVIGELRRIAVLTALILVLLVVLWVLLS